MAPKMTVRLENLVMENASKFQVHFLFIKNYNIRCFLKPFLIDNNYKIKQSRKHKT